MPAQEKVPQEHPEPQLSPTPQPSIDRLRGHIRRVALLSDISCGYEDLIERGHERGHEAIREVTDILSTIEGLLSRARPILEDL